MVSHLWDKIELYCNNGHDSLVKMDLVPMGKHQTLYYACPKGFDADRNENEPMCRNRVSVKEFEKILDHISSILYDAEMNNEVINLQNIKWTQKGIRCYIFEHNDKIKVLVYNRNEVEK